MELIIYTLVIAAVFFFLGAYAQEATRHWHAPFWMDDDKPKK